MRRRKWSAGAASIIRWPRSRSREREAAPRTKRLRSRRMNSGAKADDIVFDRSRVGPPGKLVSLTKTVRRMVADNPGPMTFTGTCTYVVGHGEVAVIDPGPDLPQHVG